MFSLRSMFLWTTIVGCIMGFFTSGGSLEIKINTPSYADRMRLLWKNENIVSVYVFSSGQWILTIGNNSVAFGL